MIVRRLLLHRCQSRSQFWSRKDIHKRFKRTSTWAYTHVGWSKCAPRQGKLSSRLGSKQVSAPPILECCAAQCGIRTRDVLPCSYRLPEVVLHWRRHIHLNPRSRKTQWQDRKWETRKPLCRFRVRNLTRYECMYHWVRKQRTLFHKGPYLDFHERIDRDLDRDGKAWENLTVSQQRQASESQQ